MSAKKLTTPDIQKFKESGERLVMSTAYDYHSARIADEAGVDSILVGDSMGMTIMGYDSTIPVTMEDMLFATKIVSRAAKRAYVVADLPFMSYQIGRKDAMVNATRLIKEGGAQAVKLEGATRMTLGIINRLSEAGIPVVGHLGLTPQQIINLGAYSVQGKSSESAQALIDDALAVEAAGAIAIVFELIPAELAEIITEKLRIPSIGIGAGLQCDGEVQVFHDILGFGTFKPRHAKRFVNAEELLSSGMKAFVDEVKSGAFPSEDQASHLDPAVVEVLKSNLDDEG